MADHITVTPGAGETVDFADRTAFKTQRVLAGGTLVVPVVTLTRPANTSAYVAGDEISNSTTTPTIMEFTNCVRANGLTGTIVSALCVDSVPSVTPPSLELWLFDTTSTPNNDNDPFAPSDAEANTCVAIIPLVNSHQTANNALYLSSNLTIPFKAASGTTSLFGRLVIRNGYTPASSEQFRLGLRIWQD